MVCQVLNRILLNVSRCISNVVRLSISDNMYYYIYQHLKAILFLHSIDRFVLGTKRYSNNKMMLIENMNIYVNTVKSLQYYTTLKDTVS